MTVEILRKKEFLTLPGGFTIKRVTPQDRAIADLITGQQYSLNEEYQRLGQGEEADARRLTLTRKMIELENRKHPLLRVWNEHLEIAPS